MQAKARVTQTQESVVPQGTAQIGPQFVASGATARLGVLEAEVVMAAGVMAVAAVAVVEQEAEEADGHLGALGEEEVAVAMEAATDGKG